MSVAEIEHPEPGSVEHPGPWTEDEYLALGETPNRTELFDGSLVVSPSPTKRHQRVVRKLANMLDEPAEQVGFLVFQEINLRLATGRMFEPDIVVADTDENGLIVEAAEVWLVVEVVSPGSTGIDRLLKPALYAAAGIPWFLRVEQPGGSVELHLQRRDGDRYVRCLVAGAGQTLVTDEPFPLRIEVDALLPRESAR